MDESTPWWNLGVIGLRLVDLVVRYALVFALTLWATDASLPGDPGILRGWPSFALVIGAPSLLISFVYGLANTRTGMAFRGPLVGLLMLPLWFLLFFPPLLLFPAAGQVVFALWVMRAPLLGPSQLRRHGRAALTVVAGLPQALSRYIRRAAP
ncbi:hypothetical protein AB0A69_23740 [Streptomyces sp. NPDC045431]|uniref:hypothetical protein n=1 Tax=Streptomyces sp. NPDC045431 TaxID=3155613 RepID=UPI0033F945A3